MKTGGYLFPPKKRHKCTINLVPFTCVVILCSMEERNNGQSFIFHLTLRHKLNKTEAYLLCFKKSSLIILVKLSCYMLKYYLFTCKMWSNLREIKHKYGAIGILNAKIS